MRIDGLSSSSLPLERSARPGSAVTPYRDVQREVEARREQPAPVSGSQGFEQAPQAPQARKVQASSAGGDSLPVSARDLLAFQRPVSSHAAMALASYNSTASLNIDAGAEDVLGLDLYA
ncbi:TPA: hypothetical protein U7301_001744 [Pseudomonas aeruginosa]|nr:hypothetical protein [Pseudomonas aeruginosa]HEN8223176.1 hypothetical protein [Pseudomonas aeruginosa]HEO1550812.1 hypothetical protein [Pseudomonas aeruginosa]